MAVMKFFDKITLEVFLANINLFRFIRNITKKRKEKKKKLLTVLGSFAIKYIIKFKVKLVPCLNPSTKKQITGRKRLQYHLLS